MQQFSYYTSILVPIGYLLIITSPGEVQAQTPEAIVETEGLSPSPPSSTIASSEDNSVGGHPVQTDVPVELTPLTPVHALEDTMSTSWALSALQQLRERYHCGADNSLNSFADKVSENQIVTRFELAAQLQNCLNSLHQSASSTNAESSDQILIIQRLQTEFAPELAKLQGQVDQLESDVETLKTQQFSTTTKLTGQAIFAINAGGFSGDRIIAPRGALISQDQPKATSLYRVSLDLNTSFQGTDLLKVRLVAGSTGTNDNAAGLLEPNLGSVLDFSIPGRDQVSLARLYYTFKPASDVSVTMGPQMVAPDFVDKNRYANVSFRDFSTAALTNNFILLPRPGGAGAAVEWQPKKIPIALRAVYIASRGEAGLPENQQFFGGGGVNDIRLFPISGGGATGGLFNDPNMGLVEFEYTPTKSFSIRFQYSGGKVLGSHFQVAGVNAELAVTRAIGLFARYGYGSPQYW
jgi:hypothetical protein